jgi:hypothetical protein
MRSADADERDPSGEASKFEGGDQAAWAPRRIDDQVCAL